MKRFLIAACLLLGSVSIASAQYPQYYQPYYYQPSVRYNYSYIYLTPQPQYGLPGLSMGRMDYYPAYPVRQRGFYQPYYDNSFNWSW